MGKLRLGAGWVFTAGLLAACSSQNSGSQVQEDQADASVNAPSKAPLVMASSPTASRRLASVRARFRHVIDQEAGSSAPAIGASEVEHFETARKRGIDRIIPVLDPEKAGRQMGPLRTELPRQADGAARVEEPKSGVAVQFALEGAREVAVETADGLVLYAGAGRGGEDIIHRVTAAGTEDFLVFEDRPAQDRVTYDIEVSAVPGMRVVSGIVEFLDRDGAPRIRVARPYLIDSRGARHDASLSVEGCAYSTDARAPWGRPVTSPAARQCKLHVSWDGASIAWPAVLDPVWTTTADLSGVRQDPLSARLQDGKVLVAGGVNGTYLFSAEIFDPATSTWAEANPMAKARYGVDMAALLPSGKVLAVGGSNPSEIYDPATGNWSSAGNQVYPGTVGAMHLVVLDSGNVLAVGGYGDNAQLWNGSSWSLAGTLPGHTNNAAAVKLKDGKVLVAGSSSVACTHLYDETTNTWSSAGDLSLVRADARLMLLNDGRALFAGGSGAYEIQQADIYTPGTGWGGALTMKATAGNCTAQRLSTGDVVFFGNQSGFNAQRFTPSTPVKWTLMTPMPNAHFRAGSALLPGDKVLVFGGYQSAKADIYEPLGIGAACSSAGDCTSGFCVNSVCCSTACTGVCQACSAATKQSGDASGTCGPAKAGSTSSSCTASAQSSCGLDGTCDGLGACAYWPGSTTCASTCANDTASTTKCSGSGACDQVTSTPCAPYRCSGNACGTSCTNHSQCAASAWCNTTAQKCELDLVQGAACTANEQCPTGFCVDGVCCDNACTGSCMACSATKKGQGADGSCGFVISGQDPDNNCTDFGAPSCNFNGNCDGAGACAKYDDTTVCQPVSCSSGTLYTAYCKAGVCGMPPQQTSCSPYGCSGNACATSCTAQSQCAATHWCNTTTTKCEPDLAQGTPCSFPEQCAGGNCVDGYCCDTACNSSCHACSAAKTGGANGTCGTAVEGTACGAATCTSGQATGMFCSSSGSCVSSNKQCAPYLCAGNGCATTCGIDADCVSGYRCQQNQCVLKGNNGSACQSGSDCGTGFCVDGVCCNSQCSGTCMACAALKTGGTDGICGGVKADTDPDVECPVGAGYPASCGADGMCDGQGACREFAKQGIECASPSCDNGSLSTSTCNGNGLCSKSTKPCSPYVCSSSSECGNSCMNNLQCASGFSCLNGQCVSQLPIGTSCTEDTQCGSGYCVDGVCCESACAGGCKACSTILKGGGLNGICENIVAGTDPDNECDGTFPCKGDGTCNGLGACSGAAPAGMACGTSSCLNGVIASSSCDGTGQCIPGSKSCGAYACDGTAACKTSCSVKADCASGFTCVDNVCEPFLENGATCSKASECVSGNCVDGVCCETKCDGDCVACTAAKKGKGTDGECGPVKNGTDPDNECDAEGADTCRLDGMCNGAGACRMHQKGTSCGDSSCSANLVSGKICDGFGHCDTTFSGVDCGAYVCKGKGCATPCATNADCTSGSFCDSGTCTAKLEKGDVCTSNAACSSGNCADGVCCDTACDGLCEACTRARKGTGSDGECGAVKDGTDPDAECENDGAASCQRDGVCDGAKSCRLYRKGTACGETHCSGNLLIGKVCDGFGTCQDSAGGIDCAPYDCIGDKCTIPCAIDPQCDPGQFCDKGTCHAKAADGVPCETGSSCSSGFCVDGVCCNTACDGNCQACSAARKHTGADGVCGNAKSGTDPHNSCADDGAASCDQDGTCDGQGNCARYAKGAACGDTKCQANGSSGFEQANGWCDGSGTCVTTTALDCGLYACKATACVTACMYDDDCIETAYCDAGTCKARSAKAQSCTFDRECSTGFCEDGVCCESACDKQCESCNLEGSKGTCAAKAGASEKGRPACASASSSNACGETACDGITRDGCKAWPGNGKVECASASCANGVETAAATCLDGKCGSPTTNKCDPYVCGATACLESCTADKDCVAGNKCSSGKCVSASTCEDNFLVSPNGEKKDCSPYLCKGSACLSTCTSLADCVTPYVCDSTGKCVEQSAEVTSTPEDDGGCGCRTAPSRGGAGMAGLVMAALAMILRRRSRAQ